ncbi:MAG: zinc-finger domain-containing protein [Brevundimonas sp.]
MSSSIIIPPPEQVVVTSKRVACDGGGGALGHPLVYMDMGEDDFVECGYCDRRFVLGAKKTAESEYHSPAARPPEAH